MNIRSAICQTLACAALFPPVISVAQTDASKPASEGKGDRIEEIVVTAQKREQRLQDVPITVSAVTADTAQRLGVQGTQDLANAVPGLIFKRASFAAAPSIRGIGSVPIAQGDESTVGIYVDGVLQVSPTVGVFSLNNIERVEVLKGPQGTLFGRNSTGGVINVITKTPSQTTSADATLGYSNFDTWESRFYGTTGLSESTAIDVAMQARHQGEGWGRDRTYDKEVYKDEEINVRSKLYSELSEDTRLTLSGTYIRSNDSRAGAFRLLQGTAAITGETYPGFYDVQSNVPDPVNHQRHYDGNLKLEHDMGWGTLASISSYQYSWSRWDYDIDATSAPLITANVLVRDRAYTQEFQVLSPRDQRVEWIGGLYYLWANSTFDPGYAFTPFVAPAPYQKILGGQKTDSLAGYGQATFEIVPKLRATLGARYTSDKRKIDAANIFPGVGTQARKDDKTFDKFTYRAALDYKITPDVLAYVSVTTGFKAGRFATDQIFQPPLDPEELTAYETGVKTQLFDGHVQFNASAFYYDYKDLQQSVLDGSSIVEINAGKAEIKGVDVDMNFVPIHNLWLQAAVSYLDAKYTSFPGAPLYTPIPTGGYITTSFDAKDNDLTRSPKWNALFSASYTIESAAGNVTLSSSYNMRSKYYWDFQNSTKEKSEDTVNASATWMSPSEKFEVGLWGKNLLDQERHINVVPGAISYITMPSEPRTYGGNFTYHFR